MRLLFFSICLSVFLAAPCARAQEGSALGGGPSPLFDQYLLTTLHLSRPPQTAALVAGGEGRTDFAWANTNILEDTYRVDVESREVRLSYRYRIAQPLELSAWIPIVWRGGGVLDPLIDGWHDFFGFPQGNRGKVRDNQFAVSGSRNDGKRFHITETGTRLGNVILGSKYRLFADHLSAVSLDSAVSLPTAYHEFGHNGIDTTLGILGSMRSSSWIWHSGAGAVFYQDTEISGVRYHRYHAEGFGGFEHEFNDYFSGLVTASAAGPVVEGISGHPELWAYLDVEARLKASEHAVLSFTIRENLSPGDGSTDVVFYFAVRIDT